KPEISQCSMCTSPRVTALTPTLLVPRPSITRPRRITTSVLLMLTFIAARSWVVATTLADVPVQSIVIDLIIVIGPEVIGSRHMMVAPATVFITAPANVLHGDTRVQGFASSPSPETKAGAWACAGVP